MSAVPAGNTTGASGTRPRLRDRVRAVAPWLLVLAGMALLARPVVTDWIFAWQAKDQISEIVSVYDDMNDEERLQNLAQARAWSDRQAGLSWDEPEGGMWDYRIQLTYRSTPDSMMAWLDVPKIGTKLPIFHGTGEAELMAGVGHCDWSELPVGGEGCRCVLTAHSGMQGTRMFDDIRLLEKGDTFTVWTLGEPYCYRVVGMEVCLPEEAVAKLAPEPGRDLCTLVTCTPFGVNTHRLLVTGERCPYDGDQTAGAQAFVNRRTIPLLLGLAALIAVLAVLVARRLHRSRSSRRTA